MSVYTFARGRVSVDVHVGHETIAVDVYRTDTGNPISHMRYSGYSLSESIAKALISAGVAPGWGEAFHMIERAGIPCVTDDDTDY
jgi:hypothetical protein